MRSSYAALALSLAGMTTPLAGDARIPVHAPTTIRAPGAYYLTRSIAGSGTLITIAADGVDLDLNGHALVGDGTGCGVDASDVAGVRVRDGIIRRVTDGVCLVRAVGVTLDRLVVRFPEGRGISGFDSDAVRITNCSVLHAGAASILISNGGSYILESNDVLGAGSTGIEAFYTPGVTIRGSRITTSAANLAPGVRVWGSDGAILDGNLIVGDFASGVLVVDSPGARVTRNVVEDPRSNGLWTDLGSPDGVVAGNTVTGAGGHGVVIEADRTLVAANLSTLSTSVGLGLWGSHNVVRRNVSRGNADDYYVAPGAVANDSAGDNYVPLRY